VLSARQEKEHDIDQDDQELIMKLSEMYQQQLAEIKKQEREEGEQQGLQKGRQEGLARERRAMIESILQVRFGELDSELATIIDQVIAMTREEFTPLLLQLSREELLARFTN
jgi:flagellar biosynthesis/type III secretory pathway protein FliH